MTCYVYWIHREVHTDPTTEGYIGITTEFDRRMWKHFRNPSNIHLARALQKYDDIKKDILWEGSRDECLLSEFFLRPEVGIGWNISRGGGMPPLLTELPQFGDIRQKISATLKHKKIPPNLERLHSPEARAKRRETAKQSARKWIYNPETGEAKQIRTALGEGVPDGWKLGKKYVQPVKASVRGVDYHCNAKVWEVTTPEGTTTQVSSLKTWCRENGYNFYEVYNSKNGWGTKKK